MERLQLNGLNWVKMEPSNRVAAGDGELEIIAWYESPWFLKVDFSRLHRFTGFVHRLLRCEEPGDFAGLRVFVRV